VPDMYSRLKRLAVQVGESIFGPAHLHPTAECGFERRSAYRLEILYLLTFISIGGPGDATIRICGRDGLSVGRVGGGAVGGAIAYHLLAGTVPIPSSRGAARSLRRATTWRSQALQRFLTFVRNDNRPVISTEGRNLIRAPSFCHRSG